MKKFAVTALLLTALAVPVALFLLLCSHFQLNGLIAAAIAIATGWALNVVWAFAVQEITAKDQLQTNGNFVSIAARYGWACPAVLVLLAWLAWRFVIGHSA